MQSIVQPVFGCFLMHELLYLPQFACTTALESARIMKDVTLVIREHKFVADFMFATLQRKSLVYDIMRALWLTS